MFSIEKLQAFLKDVVSLRESLEDSVAANYANLYSTWVADKAYETNERISYNGVVYKVLMAHTSQADWTPYVAHSLYAKVLTSANPNEVLAWEQPDSTNPYMTGDKVYHNEKTWISNCDNNVWEPGVYGWDEVIA
jgi:hypothetical protein